MKTISSHRMHAYQEAVFFVEMNADEAVREKFMNSSECDPVADRTLVIQVCRKLQRLYGPIGETESFSQSLADSFDRHSRMLPPAIFSQHISSDSEELPVDWTCWLEVYRKCLEDLRSLFGLPGYCFSKRLVIRDDSEGRLVGNPPLVR